MRLASSAAPALDNSEEDDEHFAADDEIAKDIKSMLKKELTSAQSFSLTRLQSVTPSMLTAVNGTRVLLGDAQSGSDEIWVQEEGSTAAGKQLKLFQRTGSKVWVSGGGGQNRGQKNAEFKDVIFFDKSSGQVSECINVDLLTLK